MELNCPNCTTHFSVPDDAIGPKGRKVKCAMCGHVWRQMPADADPMDEDASAESSPPPYGSSDDEWADAVAEADAAGAGQDHELGDQDFEGSGLEGQEDDFSAGDDDAFSGVSHDPSVPMEMAPGDTADRADPLDGYASEIPMESADEDAASGGMADDPLSAMDFANQDAFGDDEDLSSYGQKDDLQSSDFDDFLAAGPEPISDLFGRDLDEDGEDGQKKGKGGLILGVLVVVMLALGAGAWFGRSALVNTFPFLEPLYAMAGVEVDASSAGLVFRDVASDHQSLNGVDVLVVRGFVANVADKPRTLPYLSLVLFDGSDHPVQRVVAQPPKPELKVGETTGFRIKLENPSAAARRFDVFWTKVAPVVGKDGTTPTSGEGAPSADGAGQGGAAQPKAAQPDHGGDGAAH